MKIYELCVETTNQSADMRGYFDDREKLESEKARVKKLIKMFPEHYGELDRCFFSESILYIDNKLS